MPTVGTEVLIGLMLSKTATAAAMVTLAEADLVGSATLVAFTVTVAGDGTPAGATNSPLVEIVPHAAPVQPTPLTVHVTAVFEEPVIFPANCWVRPTATVALFGLKLIVNDAAFTVSVAVLLVTLLFELLTATLNWLPLSEVAVAGVV